MTENNAQLEAGLASDLNRELDVWQPMHTAPKKGQVLVYDKQNERFYTAHWNVLERFWAVGCFEYIEDESRMLWQALPDKPSNI